MILQCKMLKSAVRVPREQNSSSAPVRSGAPLFIASLAGVLRRSLVKKSVTIFFSATEVFYPNRL
jgi:hypothetical protein